MTGQSNSSQGRGHDRLPNWTPKNGGMLISQPVTSCLTNHSELCMSRLPITSHVGFLFIDFSGSHLWVSSLRCLQCWWQVMTLWTLHCCSEKFLALSVCMPSSLKCHPVISWIAYSKINQFWLHCVSKKFHLWLATTLTHTQMDF